RTTSRTRSSRLGSATTSSTRSAALSSTTSGSSGAATAAVVEFMADDLGALNHCPELRERLGPAQGLHTAVGRGDQPLRREVLQGLPDAVGDQLGRLDGSVVGEIEHPEDDRLIGEFAQDREVESGLRSLERNLARGAAVEFGQEGVARRFVPDDVAVAE